MTTPAKTKETPAGTTPAKATPVRKQRRTLRDFDNEALGRTDDIPNTPGVAGAAATPAAAAGPTAQVVAQAPQLPPPTAGGTLGATVRVGLYLQRPTFNDAKSAYLVDLDSSPTSPGNFAAWVAQVLAAHAAATAEQRRERAATLPEEPTDGPQGVSRSFHIPDAVIEAMNAAIIADRAAGRFLSRSEFATEAIRLAAESARVRAGGALPPPPKRLPNKPVRV